MQSIGYFFVQTIRYLYDIFVIIYRTNCAHCQVVQMCMHTIQYGMYEKPPLSSIYPFRFAFHIGEHNSTIMECKLDDVLNQLTIPAGVVLLAQSNAHERFRFRLIVIVLLCIRKRTHTHTQIVFRIDKHKQ